MIDEDWHLTLLRTSGRYSLLNVRLLPGSDSDYIAEVVHPGWVLVVTLEDGLVFFGPGPASVEHSPLLFEPSRRRGCDP